MVLPFSEQLISTEAAVTLREQDLRTGQRMLTLRRVPTETGMKRLRQVAFERMPEELRPADAT